MTKLLIATTLLIASIVPAHADYRAEWALVRGHLTAQQAAVAKAHGCYNAKAFATIVRCADYY